ncbi:membrane hypothetical protein [uncultured Desulfatiglans sp.]|uniref:Uncharacterized protein n=1 Tax=Uncultured Desulfatiglans sp. TaxID=1748965 RepID=A0A653A886_UNCDX|nr:membrane hypothetical protein [uncultured Desulfatiglans sp.]
MALDLGRYSFTLYSWVLLATAVIAVLLFRVLRRRDGAPALHLAWFELSVAAWALPIAFEAAAETRSLKLFWSIAAYPGTTMAPLFFFLFALAYSRQQRYLTGRNIAVLALPPFATTVLAATNPLHGLIWKDIVLQSHSPFAIYVHGGMFWVYIAYAYSLLLAGFVLLLADAVRYPAHYRPQTFLLLLGALFPVIGNAMYVFNLNPIPGLDWTPLAFLASGLILAGAVFRLKAFDLLPRARSQIVESLPDGIIVFDAQDRVVDINQTAAGFFARSPSDLIGRDAAQGIPLWQAIVQAQIGPRKPLVEIPYRIDGDTRWFDAVWKPLLSARNKSDGHILILRDITLRKRMEEERNQLIRELQEALEKVKTLSGLLPICANCKKIRDDQGYWKNVEDYVHEHHDGVQFSHSICPDCEKKLYPEFSKAQRWSTGADS